MFFCWFALIWKAICYDLEFPESIRMLALRGAELICLPTALSLRAANAVIPRHVVPTRALENCAFVLYSNFKQASPFERERELQRRSESIVFCGQSCIVSPAADELVRFGGDEEGVVWAQLDFAMRAELMARNDYLRDRKPQFYDAITKTNQSQ
jgi:predicted amidohydrolase